jgi:predicted DNA-binding transcriptional regulator AlpA
METVKAMKLHTMDEVAEMLRKSPAQLRWMRHNGTGPRSAKLGGRVMYREQDVIDWVNSAFEAEVPNDCTLHSYGSRSE